MVGYDVIARCHTYNSALEVEDDGTKELIEPTLVLPIGSIVGVAFSGLYGKSDDRGEGRQICCFGLQEISRLQLNSIVDFQYIVINVDFMHKMLK